MSITTDSTISVDYNGIHYDSIGLSKTLNNYTIDEIKQFAYCAGDNTLFKHITEKVNSNLVVALDGIGVPITVAQLNSTTMTATAGEQANENQGEKGVYCAVVWLSKTTSGTVDVITQNDLGSYKLITEFRAKNYVLELSNPVKVNASSTKQYGVDNWNGTGQTDNFPLWYSRESSLYYYSDDNGTVKIDLSSNRIYPFIMFTYNNKLYFFRLTPSINQFYSNYNNGYENPITGSSYSSYDGISAISVSSALQELWDANHSNTSWNFPQDWTKTGGGLYGWSYTGNCFNNDLCMIGVVNGTNSQLYSGVKFHFYFTNKNAILDFWKCCGIKFLADKLYKPIISGGYVTGYTDNLDTPSDLDTWTGNSNHEIPTTRPSGGGGNGDELLDMESRAQFYGSGVTTYYVNVPTAKLKTALGNWDNIGTGKDVLKNLISYKLFCFPTSTFTNGMLHDFVIAGTTLKDENNNNIQSAQLTQYGAVSLPSIKIPKTFNDFRDYAPYTNLSMYIPLCGWFTLPPWCMGRTISGEMYINGYTGTLKCIVRADGNVVTELGGNASIDLPFAAEAVGMKAAAVLSNLINTAGSIASIANPSAGGVANVGTAVLGTVCALNANYTESKGTMGDGSNIAGLYHVYIKISRPATIDNEGNSLVTIPTEYKRQYGLPCNKSLTLTQGDGYTQILDANITGNMTAREKQMIIDGFRRGLIL